MHRNGALVLLVCGLATGCFVPGGERSVSRRPCADSGLDPRSNLVQLDVALLERPIGDPFLNRELWNFTDQLVIGLEGKAALDDNGFRIGQIVGMPPGKLQELLTSERSCINPRRRLLPSGRSADQVLGPNWVHTEFVVQQNGQTEKISLDQAQFVLEVTPTVAENGLTTIRLVPKVQHGETIPDWQPAADGSDWTFQLQRRHMTFARLGCELNVASNSYVVVGADFDQPDSLGYRAFIQDEERVPVQRLLVLRIGRSPAGQSGSLPSLADMAGPPPLALQASTSAIRANAP